MTARGRVAAAALWVAALAAPFASVRAAENAPPIPVSAFASHDRIAQAMLSPRGLHFAYMQVADGKAQIVVHDAETRAPSQKIALGDPQTVNWFRWAGDGRLLISVMRAEENAFFRARFSRLLVFDLASAKLGYVGFKKQGLDGDSVLHIDPHGRFVLLAISESVYAQPDVWRFPLDGSGEDGAVLIEKRQKDIDRWWADDAGVVRIGLNRSSSSARIWYRSRQGEPLRKIVRLEADDERLANWDVTGIRQGSDRGHVIVKGDSGRRILREIDFNTGELGKTIFRNDAWDVEDAILDPVSGELLGLRYSDDQPRTLWLDDQLARQQRKLEAALPGSTVTVTSLAGHERMMVMQSGPSDPGGLYVYTPAKAKLDLVANLRSKLDIRELAPQTAHAVTARDGTVMRAYLTLPKGRATRNLPLIVMPHGGPYGVRDALAYEDWSQLLANRGYAVLRPNYRGSSGSGEAFEKLGDGQIGRAMQDDLDDVRAWAVKEGYADPARVRLVGASYGGYAAAWGAIRNPELYRCAVSIAGVYDWSAMLSYDSRFFNRKFFKDWRERIRGDEESFAGGAVSAVAQVKRLQRPLLVAHGTKDTVVPLTQYAMFTKAAKAAGKPLETMTLEDTHQLEKQANEEKFLTAMMDFLARHNPAD